MVPTKSQHPAVTNSSVLINQVVGCASTDIDDQNPQILLVLGDNDLSAGKRSKHDILDLQLERFDTPQGVMNPGLHPVDNVKIGLKLHPFRLERVDDVPIAVEMIGLEDRMEENVLWRNGDFLCVGLDLIKILLLDLSGMRQDMDAAVVQAPEVSSRDGDPDVAYLDVGLLLGIEDRLPNTFGGRRHIDDFTLANPTGRGFPYPKDADLVLGSSLGNNDTDLRGADLESDKDLVAGHGGIRDVWPVFWTGRPE